MKRCNGIGSLVCEGGARYKQGYSTHTEAEDWTLFVTSKEPYEYIHPDTIHVGLDSSKATLHKPRHSAGYYLLLYLLLLTTSNKPSEKIE